MVRESNIPADEQQSDPTACVELDAVVGAASIAVSRPDLVGEAAAGAALAALARLLARLAARDVAPDPASVTSALDRDDTEPTS